MTKKHETKYRNSAKNWTGSCLVGWLVFNGTFSTNRLYRAI